MGVVERATILGVHREVLDAWREIVGQAGTMGLADRIVIGVKLKARADALAAYEGLVRDAGDLAGDARAFAKAVRTQNPLTAVCCGVGVAAGGLGFFGWWSFQALQHAFTSDADVPGMAQTTVALIGVLTVAAGAVIIGVVRAAVVAAQAGLQALEIFGVNEHPSAVMLREVRPAEERLFAVFQQRVPDPPISAVLLIVLAVGGLVAGIVVAALAGVGATS
ncbi:hypothetical protein AB0E63_17490 [Kribbella sp. NPDC026596]|uniref:hypothetical protein n=1 Tax=Kribbella sp. NPDC026596 TaxID=3155122 RepID=UPI0033DE94CF